MEISSVHDKKYPEAPPSYFFHQRRDNCRDAEGERRRNRALPGGREDRSSFPSLSTSGQGPVRVSRFLIFSAPSLVSAIISALMKKTSLRSPRTIFCRVQRWRARAVS